MEVCYVYQSGRVHHCQNLAYAFSRETWKWCHIKNIIDHDKHKNNSTKRLWDESSLRWKGNQGRGQVKQMHLTQHDLAWVNADTGTITLPLNPRIVSIEMNITKAYR